MKKISHLFPIAAIFACGLASANENHFEGGYMVLSQEWKKASVSVADEKIRKSEAAPSIGIGYTFALDSHVTMGIKASIDIKKGEYGVGETALGESEVKEKSHFSFAFEPGYAVNKDVLLFGILAYHRANAELLASEDSRGTGKINGFGYGVGAKYALPNHLFLMGEIQKVNYRGQVIGGFDVKPSSTVISLGLGYHF